MQDESPRGHVPAGDPAQDELRLLDYWRVLARRRHLVLACLVGIVAVATVLTLVATPLYRATATLQIARQGPDILTYQDVLNVDPSWADYQDFYQTQYKILQSRTVLRIAAERLDLVNRPEFATRRESPGARFGAWVRARLRPARHGEPDPTDLALLFLVNGLTIHPVRSSHLVKVSFTDRDRALASDTANAIATAYQEFNLRSRYSATAQASEFLTKQVAQVQAEIAGMESRLQDASVRKEILALRDDTTNITSQALADLSAQSVAAKGRLALAEARLAALQSGVPDSLAEVLASPLILGLKSQYAEIERRRSQLAERFGADWPAMRQLDEELSQARERLEIETRGIARQVRSVVEADHARARAEVESLGRRVDEQKLEVQRVNRDAAEVASMKAEIDTRRRFLADLVGRQSQTEVSDRLRDTQASNVRVVDPAEIPEQPVSPRKRFNLVVAVLLGLAVGVGAAFLADHVDNTVKGEQDLERTAKLPVFGHVPLFEPLRAVPDAGAAQAGTQHPIGLASWLDPRSAFSEAFRNLRTSLLLASPDRPPRIIVVTSCEPSDGKSTVSVNLAVVLTQLGRRVLLIDSDLRRPRLHRIFAVGNAVGLSSLMTGNATFEDVVQDCDIPGLALVSSGPLPPNPSELLQSASLQAMIERLRSSGEFDHVIFDSPPSVQVADSLILAARADATIVVVRSGKTARDSLVAGVARLRQAHVHVSGAVLNAVREQDGYYYQYKYRYYRTGAESASEAPGRFARFKRKRQSRSA